MKNPVGFFLCLAVSALIGATAILDGCGTTPTSSDKNYYGTSRTANILVLNDVGSTGITFEINALDRLGLTYTLASSIADFNNKLISGAWDVLVMDHSNAYNETLVNNIKDFIKAGGSAVYTTFSSDHYPTNEAWHVLGSTCTQAADTAVHDVHKWNASHPIFTTPYSVPDLTGMNDYFLYTINNCTGDAFGEGTAEAGVTSTETTNTGNIFISHDGKVVYNSFLFIDIVDGSGAALDNDSDGIPDGVELYANEIHYVLKKTSTFKGITLSGINHIEIQGSGKHNSP